MASRPARTERTDFSPVEKSAAAHQAVSQIRRMVVSGRLKPGQALPPERDLAVLLGVSRSTLREAIRALALVNVLESRHGTGTFVTSLDPALLVEPVSILFDTDASSLLQLFDARRVIESGAAGLAALNITDDELAELDQLVTESSQCVNDSIQFSTFDVQIHNLVIRATRNPLVIKIAESVASLARESRNRTTRIDSVRDLSHKAHLDLARQLRLRDPKGASEAMESHLEGVRQGYLTSLHEASEGG